MATFHATKTVLNVTEGAMIKVRKYQSGDREQLQQLACALYATQHVSADPEGTDVKAHFKHLLKTGTEEGAVILVATLENELLGFVCLLKRVNPERQTADAAYAFLSDLFVLETYRNKGVGAMLNGEAESLARQAGANRLVLKVLAENSAAVDFYSKQHYEEKFRVLEKVLDDNLPA